MDTVKDRIIYLMTKDGRDMKRDEFAAKVGISAQALSKYLNEGRLPNTAALVKIADKFDVSIDWLMGRQKLENATDEELSLAKKLNLSDKAIRNLEELALNKTIAQQDTVQYYTSEVLDSFLSDDAFIKMIMSMAQYIKGSEISTHDRDEYNNYIKGLVDRITDFSNQDKKKLQGISAKLFFEANKDKANSKERTAQDIAVAIMGFLEKHTRQEGDGYRDWIHNNTL